MPYEEVCEMPEVKQAMELEIAAYGEFSDVEEVPLASLDDNNNI